ncbi:LysM peptidoglycan-binding domain-containing protein [Allochromatium palmeri]|uniref:LysM peptidoglycan-binding domain-containing protein n=1 Tax=Allochromatium palmeri TaxID=231048 RepID=A0A6N8E775_9GAMM|nr:LysM peptidoglycan-binding domain-containing protein [Allochromatium palmeri]MTW20092.1 LysM peptidoglycan-binding domain-containing protein [Allochromatium palmeri]
MRYRSSRRESTAWSREFWILLIVLAGMPVGLALASEPAPDAEPETATSQATAAEGAAATPEPSHQRFDELQQRVEGMEGKLRESAHARKSADQARMEAERRLAEAMQTLEALRANQADLEQRLSNCESARTQLDEALQQHNAASKMLYRVRPGDSLALISLRVYGRSDQWQRIFEANRHQLANPDRLTPGMTLVIP